MISPTIEIPTLTDNIVEQNQLLSLQNRILQLMVTGEAEFQQQLDMLCHCAEELVADAVASIMLFQQEQDLLRIQSAPSAGRELMEELSGHRPSIENGFCSHTVFTGGPVYASSSNRDEPGWLALREIADRFGIEACWSHPVFISGGAAAGSFALISFEHREPSVFHKNLLKVCASLVSIIMQQKVRGDESWRINHHDTLTGLPNRLLVDSHLKHALRNADRNNTRLALMFIDLDNFRDINDCYGHKFGDIVLLESMNLIQKCLRQGDIVARYGGDKFFLILENFSDKLAVDQIARKVMLMFQSPMKVKNETVMVHFSIGISLFPDDAESAQQLLRNADIAMYQAKITGKNNIQYFEQKLADRIYSKARIEQQLREALTQNELELYYQPTFIADSDKMDGMEALIRWNHPDRGLLLPAEFLPVAEQSHLISEITLHVFYRACAQGAEWIQLGFDLPRISVNFSTSQLTEDCAQRMDEILQSTGLPAEKIEIEITETLLMNRGKLGINDLLKIRSCGIALAMDDFGTGYSCLSQLQKLPLDKLKIDQSFITNLETDEGDQAIVKTIIAMGKSLNIKIVAEGVETAGQQDFLLQHGCDSIQGFHRSQALPAIEMERLLYARNINPAISR
jgi:diguanylate cyclase (GGDEF)-like protein